MVPDSEISLEAKSHSSEFVQHWRYTDDEAFTRDFIDHRMDANGFLMSLLLTSKPRPSDLAVLAIPNTLKQCLSDVQPSHTHTRTPPITLTHTYT